MALRKLTPGMFFEIPVGRVVGYCQFVWRDPSFAYLFKVFSDLLEPRHTLDVTSAKCLHLFEWAYINVHGEFGKWRPIGNFEIVEPVLPTGVYYGDDYDCGIVSSVFEETGTLGPEKCHAVGTVTEKEMRRGGFVQQKLWLAENIVALLEMAAHAKVSTSRDTHG